MTPSAPAAASSAARRAGEGKPVSRLSTRSWASSRSSRTCTSTSSPARAGPRRRRWPGGRRAAGSPTAGSGRPSRPRGCGGSCGNLLGGLLSGCGRGSEQGLVGRRLGHVRRLAGRERLAQRRDDLLAEQVELLEDGLERKPGVVHQEQLALVVADVLAEAEGPLDHLLR